ncbi:MAG: hypothetical protein COX80_00715 [Candidatus Magasanikbacteria bacterium CG_4_10_14_0_2_um_filter_33_14]|uniref:Uncharacterized protein n=1 Tax=Candidatus Magasanikbacteria bacterium CG_4_10_14_0_2_um_filter_33_14 TaxID=1974636 RepID=A0A2M7VC56_9BACT|nr:MAG: hypothetical protein COX80_00715 [Candidatus Magasanikbacteria bacterium CG_4_10_14_0_2_um_filter_33_14]
MRDSGIKNYPLENRDFSSVLEEEQSKEVKSLPRDLTDFCIVRRSIEGNYDTNNPDEILDRGLEPGWMIMRFKENGSVLAIKKSEKIQVEGQVEVQKKTFDRKIFWPLNFLNAEFVLDQLRADYKSSSGEEKIEYSRYVQAFYKADVSGILEYVTKMISFLEEKVVEYENSSDNVAYERKRKEVLAAKMLLDKNMGKPSSNVFSRNWTVKNAEFVALARSEAKYQENTQNLEKFITAMHSLLFVEGELKKPYTAKED